MLLGEDGRGTSISVCLPLSAAANAARIATSVLPKPTSPQTSRSIGLRRLEVGLDRLDRALLVLGLAVGELRLEPLQPVAREVERDARRALPARIEREQLPGELVHARARARLDQLPGAAAELGQRRRARVRADVAGDLPDLLVRDVEAVVAPEGELEVVARDLRDRSRLEAEELPDAVVLVDDVVAGAQVGERLERATEVRVARGAAACGRPACRAGGRGRARARRSLAARARPRTGAPASRGSSSSGSSSRASMRRSRFCVRSASPRCGNATTTRCPPRTKPCSSFSASASPRAAIAGRCASKVNG